MQFLDGEPKPRLNNRLLTGRISEHARTEPPAALTRQVIEVVELYFLKDEQIKWTVENGQHI